MTLIVVDYGRGNLFSLGQALRHIGVDYALASAPDRIASASRLILPGVGAFADCMRGLAERGLIAPLLDAVGGRRVPLLGICVGMQIMAGQGEEFGVHPGLKLIAGTVRRLPDPAEPRGKMRVPNVGWRTLNARPESMLFAGVPPDTMAYFVHSYAMEPDDGRDVAATFDFNGRAVPAIVQRGHVLGYQFHPEKSGPAGHALLARFLEIPAP